MLLLPQLGFALFFVTNVSASMITSVIVDHTGFMGTPQKRVGRWSGAGLAMTVTGALLFSSSGLRYVARPPPKQFRDATQSNLTLPSLFDGWLQYRADASADATCGAARCVRGWWLLTRHVVGFEFQSHGSLYVGQARASLS